MKSLIGLLAAAGVVAGMPAQAAGVAPGTQLGTTAVAHYTINSVAQTASADAPVLVDELIDVTVTWQNTGDVPVQPGNGNKSLLFRVTNTGSGTEKFKLTANPALTGDNFDPVTVRIYFDNDSSGDFSSGDTQYNPGSGDPNLAAGTSVNVLVVSNIPGGLNVNDVGDVKLNAISDTFTGTPGSASTGTGDGGVDAVVGLTGGKGSDKGAYQIQQADFAIVKSAVITDPAGGNNPVPGAIIQYTIKVKPTGTNSASSAVVTDSIPVNTTYVPGSLTLNGGSLGDGTGDSDAGDYNVTHPGAITVDLGALPATASVQTITFKVLIN